MTSPNAELPFDDGRIRAQLIGTWSCPSIDAPPEIDYLHFHESGVVLMLVHNSRQLDQPLKVRMKYSIESPSRLRVRNIKGNQTGWTNEYQLEGDTLTIVNPERPHLCQRVAPEKVPEWLREVMAKYL